MSFLESVHVSDLPSHQSHKSIFYVDTKQHAQDALQIMVAKNVYSIPVYDDGKCLGLMNLRNVVSHLVHLFYAKAGINVSDTPANKITQLSKHSFSSDEIAKITHEFNHLNVKQFVSSPFTSRPVSASLKDIVNDLSTNERVAIVDDKGKVTDVVSQAVIVKYLTKHMDQLGAKVNEKIENLNIITSPVETVNTGTSSLLAFTKMIEGNFSSLGIVDEEKQVVGIISFKDIRGAVGDFRSLLAPVEDYINRIRRQDFRDVNPTVNCRSSDPLSKVILKLDAVGIHRLFVSTEKDKGHHFSGILTLANVLSVLRS